MFLELGPILGCVIGHFWKHEMTLSPSSADSEHSGLDAVHLRDFARLMAGTKGPGLEAGPRKYAYNIDAVREREMHLFLPYWGFSQSEKFAQQSVGQAPNISRDSVLTVFAQLASLRLNATRAFISLFDRTTEHVVAEATARVSLRGAERSGSLWLGVQRHPRHEIPMCDQAMKRFTDEGQDMYLVPDLTRDPLFHSHSSVTGPPHNRFYVSVPIQSPDSYIIGSVAVLDDRPRESLTEDQAQFLKELSSTVMDHLLCQRAMREEYREEKMVRALGLFVRGKSDLSEGIYSRNRGDDKATEQLERVNKKLENLQVSSQNARGGEQDSTQGRTTEVSSDTESRQEPQGTEKQKSRSPVQKFTSDPDIDRLSSESNENKQRPRLSPTTSQLQKTLAPSNVQSALNRASRLMNQALDVEGAIFIDASVYARRQMIGSGGDNHEEVNSFSVGSDAGSEPDLESSLRECMDDDIDGPRSLVLGHSTLSMAGKDTSQQDSHYVSLPGSFVARLIDRYPRGKIFHIEKDGSIALSYEGLADDVSQAYMTGDKRFEEGSPEEKDLQQETMDIKYIHQVLPDARCVAIYPVWDFQRGRWFTVNLVWTNDPGRVLSEPKDLTYVAAFSNTVMAEVSRMDLEAADRAKGDFISSISHELRSPLHGVLGTVELLQETATSYTQRGLIETVYSCGRTLLDTLNHLLDYAKINTLALPREQTEHEASEADNNGEETAHKLAVPGLIQDEDVGMLVQEVAEGLLAGAEFYRRETDSVVEPSQLRAHEASASLRSPQKSSTEGNLMTIVDIEWQPNWHYSVYAGAWRRVVMNLYGNALKYTKGGYIRLFMKKDSLTVRDKGSVPAVRITISDSGRGMSQDFLLHHLYIPFLQEDTQSPGLGVGLHLVHQIVKSLDGQIQFHSEIGRGTQVDVVLPVSNHQSISSLESPYNSLREQLKGKTVSFFTQTFERGNLGIKPEVFDSIRQSLSRMVTDWFELKVLSSEELQDQRPDFLIVTEYEYRTMSWPSPQSNPLRSIHSAQSYPLIVLSGKASSWGIVKESHRDQAIFLSQPVSPKTLATVFEYCLNQGQVQEEPETAKGIQDTNLAPSGDATSRADDTHQSDIRDEGESEPKKMGIEEHANEGSSKNFPTQPKSESPSKTVLLVEDNPVNLKIIETCVKNAGFQYATATNGLEAVEKFRLQRFNAVIMDISMPVMNGLSAAREMRHFERANAAPPTSIIILTAVLSAEIQEEARMSGANEFLTKPTPLKQLREMLQKLP
ncbi:uncharacterized protein N7459_006297 [Penicillium hispanicum]|uniref:uncharacterized protein n=1 Tax=Penicillium hispanicum TaxID=1080232 RepID=UPI00253F713A|nr:uncharacterized protein N7459_006297 [Penicillium hispanicum]KAJ5580312.1 hypothetical protein N7459_006297 [Penicillium hispanicum]